MKKGKLLQFALLLVVWLLVPWRVGAQQVFVSESFNTSASGLPVGWLSESGSGDDSNKWSYTTSGFDGGGMMINGKLPYWEGPYCSYLLTPEFKPTATTSLDFKMKWQENEWAMMIASVLVTYDNGLTYPDTLWSDMEFSDWKDYHISLADYVGKRMRIAFACEVISEPVIGFIDDVRIGEPPLCPQPVDMIVTDLQQTSATVRWSLGVGDGVPDRYFVEVKRVADGQVVITDTVVSADNSAKFAGLTEGTTYSVIVRADCATSYKGQSEFSETFVFRTPTTPEILTYSIDFNKNRTLPGNWYYSGNVTLNKEYNRGEGSGRCLKLSNAGEVEAMAITPQLNHQANDMQFTAYVNAALYTKFEAGLTSDPSDPSAFFPMYKGEITAANTWTEVRFNTAGYTVDPTATNLSFVILLPADKPADLYLDDVKIEKIPACQRPNNFESLSVDSTAAYLSWVDISTVVKHELSIKTSEKTQIKSVQNSSMPYKLDGLTPDSEYSVRVRAINSTSDTSEWTNPIEFRTMCGVRQQTVYFEGFEGIAQLPKCWQSRQIQHPDADVDLGDKAWGIANSQRGKVFAGNNSLCLSDQGANARTLLFMQPVYIDAAYKYDVSFMFYRCSSNNGAQGEGVRLYINDKPDTAGAKVCEFLHSGFDLSPVEKAVGWYKYEYIIKQQGVVYFILEGVNKGKDNLYIDNFQVSVGPDCRKIDKRSFVFGEQNSGNVAMSWTPAISDNTEWILRYSIQHSAGINSDTVLVQNKPEFTFTKLPKGADVKIFGTLATKCSASDTSEFVSFEHWCSTDCQASMSVPFIETFESLNRLPVCWTSKQTVPPTGLSGNDFGDEAWTNYETLNATSGKRMIVLKKSKVGAHTNLISPALDIPASGNYILSLQMFRAAYDNQEEGINVWINSTPDTVNGTKLGYIPRSMEFNPVEQQEGVYKYEFPITKTGKQYIVIEGISTDGGPIYIDDVVVARSSNCSKLFDPEIDSLAYDMVRIKVEEIAEWQLEYGLTGFVPSTGILVSTSTPSNCIDVIGLSQKTNYELRVRRICKNGNDVEYSDWSRELGVSTPCQPYEVTSENEFFDGFEDLLEGSTVDLCYSQDIVAGDEEFFAAKKAPRGNVLFSAYQGNMMLINKYENNRWIFTPLLLNEGVTYEISGYFVQDDYPEGWTSASLAVASAPNDKFIVVTVVDKEPISNTWEHVYGYFTVPMSGVYYAGWNMAQNGSPWYHGMDNLRVRRIDCKMPTELLVTDNAVDSAVINWKSEAVECEIKVFDVDVEADSETGLIFHDTIVSNNGIYRQNIRNLESNAEYFYAVRSICGDKASDWSKMGSFRTKCGIVNVPYTDDFDDYYLEKMLCWTMSGGNGYAYSEDVRHNGIGSVRLKNVTAISPQFNVQSLSNYMINGWVRASEGAQQFEIGVLLDPNDPSGIESMATISVPEKNRWYEFTAYFNEVDELEEGKDASKYVSIAVSGEVDFYFDDLLIEEIPACPKPTEVNVDNITDHSFDLSFSSTADVSLWKVTVKDEVGDLVVDTVIDKSPSTIGGLLPVTHYSVEMVAKCSETLQSYVTDCGSFVTQCVDYTLPYDMSVNTDAELPRCWSLVDGSEGESKTWETIDDAEEQETYLQYKEYALDPFFSTVASPILDLMNDESATLVVDAYVNATADSMEVWVSTDGGKTFGIALDTIVPSAKRGIYRYDMTPYVGNRVSVAFKAHAARSSSAFARIYGFEVISNEDCVRPVIMRMKEISGYSASLVIVDTVASHNKWEVAYGKKGFNVNNVTPETVTKSTVEIEKLLPLTSYQAYVRTVCPDGGKSIWRGPFDFTTTCAPMASIPYVEDFEVSVVDNLCHLFLNLNADKEDWSWMVNYFPNIKLQTEPEKVSTGYSSLEIRTSDDVPLVMVFPEFDVSLDSLAVSLDYMIYLDDANIKVELGVLSDVSDYKTFEPLVSKEYENDGFCHLDFHFNSLTESCKDKRLALRVPPASSSELYVIVDNIQVVRDSKCPAVSKFELNSVNANSVSLNVEANADKVILAYGAVGSDVNNCSQSITAAPGIVEMEDLIPGDAYYVYARSICGTDSGFWSEPMLVAVPCAAENVIARDAKWLENFDADPQFKVAFPKCFTPIVTSFADNIVYPASIDKDVVNAPRALKFKGIGMVALPKFDLPAERLNVSYSIKGSGNLFIGMTDSLSVGDVVMIASDHASSAGLRCNHDLSLSGHKGRYVVLYTEENADVSVDSLIVEWAPTCFAPRNLEAMPGDTVLDAYWTGAPEASIYEYRIATESDIIEGTVHSNNLSYHPLIPATKYTLYVRGICGSDIDADTTEWSSVKFVTVGNISKVPFFTGFENNADNARWSFMQNNSLFNKFVFGSAETAVDEGKKALYISNNGGADHIYNENESTKGQHIYRSFYLEPGNYSCSYSWLCNGEGTFDMATVMLVPTSIIFYQGGMLSLTDDGIVPLMGGSEKLSGATNWQSSFNEFEIEKAGYYNLLISWKNDAARGKMPPIAIDNLMLKKLTCVNVLDVSLQSVSANSAVLQLNNENNLNNVEYRLKKGVEVVDSKVVQVENNTLELLDLIPATNYSLDLRIRCSDNDFSSWKSIDFVTDCEIPYVTATAPLKHGFEEYTTDRTVFNNCWQGYSEQTMFEVRTQVDAYDRMPFEGSNYVTLDRYYDDRTYTSVKLEGGKYYQISVMGKLDGEFGCDVSIIRSDEAIIPLVTDTVYNTWKKVSAIFYAPVTDVYQFGFSARIVTECYYLCLDNFEIVQLPFGMPTGLAVDNISTHSATLTWQGFTTEYQVNVSDERGHEVLDTTVRTTSLELANRLQPSTVYTVRVRSVEGEEMSGWTSMSMSSLCGVMTTPFSQNFNNVVGSGLPVCWNNVITGTDIRNAAWVVEGQGDSRHMSLNTSLARGLTEVRLPAVDITQPATKLSFDYTNTSLTDHLQVKLLTDGDATVTTPILDATRTVESTRFEYDLSSYVGSRITVVFSTNATYEGLDEYMTVDNVRINCLGNDEVIEDSICPGNAYRLNGFDIPAEQLMVSGTEEFTRFEQPLKAGECDRKVILQLKVMCGGVTNITDTVCGKTPYVSEAFPKGISVSGNYRSTVKSTSGCDSTVNLTLYVSDPSEEIYDTICQGGSYEFGGELLSKAGVYADTIISVDGCDTVRTLYLTVLQRDFVENETVCHGGSIVWCDTTLTTTGTYVKRYKNYKECDSIHTIHFTVLPDTVRIDSIICLGLEIQFGDTTLKTSGVYIKEFEGQTYDCDSIVRINLEVKANDTIPYDETVCEGYPYTGHGFKDIVITQDTVLYGSRKDADGCVTIERINIDFTATVLVDTTITLPAGSTYTFCGTTYTASTKATCNEISTVTGCDSITNLTLVIGEGSAVNGSRVLPLTLAPNPVLLGQPTFVHRTWTVEEQYGLTVEVLNSVGQIVYSDRPEYYPIRLIGMEVSGVYYIRITTGTGEIYVGKLIVK